VPKCQKIKKGGLDQYDTERFGRVIFATIRKSGTERVKWIDFNKTCHIHSSCEWAEKKRFPRSAVKSWGCDHTKYGQNSLFWSYHHHRVL